MRVCRYGMVEFRGSRSLTDTEMDWLTDKVDVSCDAALRLHALTGIFVVLADVWSVHYVLKYGVDVRFIIWVLLILITLILLTIKIGVSSLPLEAYNKLQKEDYIVVDCICIDVKGVYGENVVCKIKSISNSEVPEWNSIKLSDITLDEDKGLRDNMINRRMSLVYLGDKSWLIDKGNVT